MFYRNSYLVPKRKLEFFVQIQADKILTPGIRLYFTDYNFISNAYMGYKDSFVQALLNHSHQQAQVEPTVINRMRF